MSAGRVREVADRLAGLIDQATSEGQWVPVQVTQALVALNTWATGLERDPGHLLLPVVVAGDERPGADPSAAAMVPGAAGGVAERVPAVGAGPRAPRPGRRTGGATGTSCTG